MPGGFPPAEALKTLGAGQAGRGEQAWNLLTTYGRATYGRVSQVALVVKNLPANAGDVRDGDSTPGWGRSPGEGHGNPLRYSCWRIPRTEEPGKPWGHKQSDTTE